VGTDVVFGIFCRHGTMKTAVDVLGTPTKIESLVTETSSYDWIGTLIANACGYASVILPGFLIIQFLKRSNYLQRHGVFVVINNHRCYSDTIFYNQHLKET